MELALPRLAADGRLIAALTVGLRLTELELQRNCRVCTESRTSRVVDRGALYK